MKWPFFKKNQRKKEEPPEPAERDAVNPMEEALLRAVDEKREEDPLIGAKIGAKEVLRRLVNGMKENDPKGVHVESLVCALASLAGYACQAGLRRELIEEKGFQENQVFAVIETSNGERYYFGDQVNRPLAESRFSVWSLAAGAAQHLGVEELPDLAPIFRHVAETVGKEGYGIPRVPEGHNPGDTPRGYVAALWPLFLPLTEKFCGTPHEWPVLFGLALQEAILMGKDALDPALALVIAMESAIPMSKADIPEAAGIEKKENSDSLTE